jgi:hypothetical protein
MPACKVPIVRAIRFHACHARLRIEVLLEKRVDEGRNGGTLRQYDQSAKQEKTDHHRRKPPFLVRPKI